MIRGALGDALTPSAFVALVASRILVRGTIGLTPLVVSAAWSADDFAEYATAMAAFVFVVPLISSGLEKSALKLLPGSGAQAARLVALYLALLAAVGGAVAVWVALVAARSSSGGLALLAGVFAALLGANLVLVAVHRALARIWLDIANQAGLFAGLCAGLACATSLGASPAQTLAAWIAVLALSDAILAAGLFRWTSPRRPGWPLAAAVGRDVVLQGATEALTAASVGVVYVAVALSGRGGELPKIYVVLGLATVLSAGYSYVLRILQPSVALRLRAGHDSVDLRRLRRWGSRAVVLAAAYGIGVLVLGRSLVLDRPGPSASWWLLGVLAAYLPLLMAVAGTHFLFENYTEESLRTTVRGAAAGLAAVAVVGFPLIAWAGAVGALAALVAGDLVHLGVLARALGRPRRLRAPSIATAS